jgi:hypothetical protein
MHKCTQRERWWSHVDARPSWPTLMQIRPWSGRTDAGEAALWGWGVSATVWSICDQLDQLGAHPGANCVLCRRLWPAAPAPRARCAGPAPYALPPTIVVHIDVRGGGALQMRVAVPTGNFGDVLAGHYARALGVPITVRVPPTPTPPTLLIPTALTAHRYMRRF